MSAAVNYAATICRLIMLLCAVLQTLVWRCFSMQTSCRGRTSDSRARPGEYSCPAAYVPPPVPALFHSAGCRQTLCHAYGYMLQPASQAVPDACDDSQHPRAAHQCMQRRDSRAIMLPSSRARCYWVCILRGSIRAWQLSFRFLTYLLQSQTRKHCNDTICKASFNPTYPVSEPRPSLCQHNPASVGTWRQRF